MPFRNTIWVVALGSLVAVAMACGSDSGDGETDATSGGARARQSSGLAPQATPTFTPAQAEAKKASSVSYRGAYGSGGVDTDELTAAQAVDNVGKQGKVCGTVMSTVYEPEHRLKITFLNFDKAEDPDFFVYFWHIGQRNGKWPDIEDSSVDITTWFNGKTICAKGVIGFYRAKPSISIGQWPQIEIRE